MNFQTHIKENELLLVAIVEFENDHLKLKIRQNDHLKLKIRQNDILECRKAQHSDLALRQREYSLMDSAYVTGSDLYQIVVHKLQGMNHKDTQNEPNNMRSSIRMEIYNPNRSKFETLVTFNECNVIKRFGKRIRCIVTMEKETHARHHPAIMGRFFHFDPNGIEFAGKNLVIGEIINNATDQTGLNVWDGSLFLARFLEERAQKIRSKSVLELGAGCGLVGIAAGMLGAKHVVLTDLDYCISLMKNNLDINLNEVRNAGCFQIHCMPCDWFNPPNIQSFQFHSSIVPHESPDVILVADCVWVADLIEPLLRTLEQYCTPKTEVIISYQRRGKSSHEMFYNGLHKVFGSIVEIDNYHKKDSGFPKALHLLLCKQKVIHLES